MNVTVSMKRDAAPAKEELEYGVARLLALWDANQDLCSDGARKIVEWLLSHERLSDALREREGKIG